MAFFWGTTGDHILDKSIHKIALGKTCDKPKAIFDVEIVKTEESRSKGLGGKKQLLPQEGMLFVFSPAQRVSFWMKDTLIPLQIGFFDSAAKLFERLEMPLEKDPSHPLRTYPSVHPALLALEVNPRGLQALDAKNTVLCIEAPKKETQEKKK